MGHSVSYYHRPTDTERHPAAGERRIDTSAWITPVNGIWTADDLTACGFAPVTATVRPVDTDTHTTDRSVVLVDGVPTEQWTSREWTVDELAARNAPDPRAALLAEAVAATTVAKLRAVLVAALDANAI